MESFNSSKDNLEPVLPVQLQISFRKIYELIVQYASKDYEKHPFHSAAIKIKIEIEKNPFLIDGFSDFSLVEKHREIIDIMLEPLFPELLQNNEIKAAVIPYNFKIIKLSSLLQDVVKNAGANFELKIRNNDPDYMYRQACSFILESHYGYDIELLRPMHFDIPNTKTGTINHYRVMYNNHFSEFEATDKAPKITDEDYKKLLQNFDNIALWKEKFPPNSYIFKGFGIVNLFDVSFNQTISDITTELLTSGDDLGNRIQLKMREFFKIKDLRMGFSTYDMVSNNISTTILKQYKSVILNDQIDLSKGDFFCNHIEEKIFVENKDIVISDVEAYGKGTKENAFYNRLKKENIGSIIIIPFLSKNKEDLTLIEIMSPRPYELNSINQQKLIEILPVFKTAIERSNTERKNLIDAIIQEKYTSIHPSVQWKFIDAAEKYQQEILQKKKNIKIDEIVFNEVYPLYGQSDIKGSSIARNNAIKEDLTTQLTLAINVLSVACQTEQMPIYNELMFRIEEYLAHVNKGLQSGDETTILSFLKREIYPVFTHVRTLNTNLEKLVKTYVDRLDNNLQVVYEKRKAYEDSVTILNYRLSRYIDKKQKEAQAMFPHYFERYKTDGVEYNMYIGQSLVNDKTYNSVYLHNLQLWQLQLMCEMENVAMKATEDMEHELRVASLILIHSNPLSIKFRMDEKQFDVDGAYNIRYEIIKKRIDKAHIKGTTERLTVPNKIAIVYSQEKDVLEYKKYIKYLQSKNKLGKFELVELEDLQGVSGLKAIRVEVIYDKEFNGKSNLTFDELIKDFN